LPRKKPTPRRPVKVMIRQKLTPTVKKIGKKKPKASVDCRESLRRERHSVL